MRSLLENRNYLYLVFAILVIIIGMKQHHDYTQRWSFEPLVVFAILVIIIALKEHHNFAKRWSVEPLLREKLGKSKGRITPHEYLSIQSLSSDTKYSLIQNISNLQYCKNLEYLDLSNNSINNIKPLESLKKLKFLHLKSNQIRNLQPLHNLTNLEILDVSNNQIADVSPLIDENLKSLNTVVLTGNPLNDESINAVLAKLQSKGVEVIY